MKRPLVLLTLIFCLGIFVAHTIKIPFLLVYSLAIIFLVLSILSVKKGLRFNIFLLCLVFFLSITLSKNAQSLPKCHISNYVRYKNNQPYIIKGFINDEPVVKNNNISFILKAETIQFGNLNHICCGNILVYLKGKQNLHYGEDLILNGNLYQPFSFNKSNRQTYRNYLRSQGIWFIMRVVNDANLVRLNRNKGWWVKKIALWLKNKMEETISQRTSPLTASVLEAMILGEKKNIPRVLYNSMIKSGTVHILVVSGFNVGIVTFVIVLFLKLIRLPKRLRLYLSIPLLMLYCLITGASTPVIRATVMAIVFILGLLIKRESDIYNSLSLAAIFILMINPRQLFDIGFQLSFASVISIVFLYPKIRSFLHLDTLKIKYIRFLVDASLVSFSAWLGTLGLVAYYFRIFSPITVLANLFIVPLASLITLSGFSLIFMSLICPPIVQFFALATELFVTILFSVNTFLLKLPGASFCLP